MTSKASHDIGWIGLGRTGQAMTARLVKDVSDTLRHVEEAAMTDDAGERRCPGSPTRLALLELLQSGGYACIRTCIPRPIRFRFRALRERCPDATPSS
jgi:hypothetical protein